MGRTPCCEKEHTNKGAWTKEEDQRLTDYIGRYGEGYWRSLPKAAGGDAIPFLFLFIFIFFSSSICRKLLFFC
ncbi:hypothetical protein SAY87_011374 [Trapa incisa]|uniref:Uncharacterized protein n=1 Tax=Trapa incisa TaxID=236973 RepID=A0AAN7GZ36_9MYRT|nr:hypothetical protein SAY87_011374 [Trapa incisa]